jgi:cytoskeletal protein CcmA (bactofilin family)
MVAFPLEQKRNAAMALWKDQTKPSVSGSPEPMNPARFDIAAAPEPRSEPVTPIVSSAPPAPLREKTKSESLIAPDITIEGKIEGSGHVRIAGRFKGDVNVRGDLTIEPSAHVTGSVRADKVLIAGELIGNIEAASHVELLQSGALTGDLKAASLTVASGSRMRGQADFGWDDAKVDAPRKSDHNGAGHAVAK